MSTDRTDTATAPSYADRYRAAMALAGGACPIEAGLLGRLADNECRHGRLPFDATIPCGCWPQEPAALLALPHRDRPRAPGRAA